MAKLSDIIKAGVKSALGAPLLPVELDIQDNDIKMALFKYYSFVPIKVVKNHNFAMSNIREIAQGMNELMPDYSAAPDWNSNFFYIGVISFAPRLMTTAPRMNEYLLGTAYMWPNDEPAKQSLINTLWDINTGDPYFEENFHNNEVRWVVGGACILSVVYGIGQYDLDKTPPRHVELMTYLVGEKYYERLLAIRDSGDFPDADFRIKPEVVKSALEKAVSRSTEILESISLVPVTSG